MDFKFFAIFLKQYFNYIIGSLFDLWRKLEYLEKTTILLLVTDQHYHIHVSCIRYNSPLTLIKHDNVISAFPVHIKLYDYKPVLYNRHRIKRGLCYGPPIRISTRMSKVFCV